MAIDTELTPIQEAVESEFRKNFSRFFEPDFVHAFARFLSKATFCRPFSVSVGTAAVQLVPFNPSRIRVSIFNNGSATVFYGSRKVTTGSAGDPNAGFPLAASTGIILDDTTAEIWAVSGSSAMDVRVDEIQADGL